jgi:hypothetical protein
LLLGGSIGPRGRARGFSYFPPNPGGSSYTGDTGTGTYGADPADTYGGMDSFTYGGSDEFTYGE